MSPQKTSSGAFRPNVVEIIVNSEAPDKCDLLVTADWVSPFDGEASIHGPGAVVIAGVRVAWLGPNGETTGIQARARIDRLRRALMLGHINAHAVAGTLADLIAIDPSGRSHAGART